MTPKQKAISLFNRYVNLLPTGSNVERAKQGALMAIDQIIDLLEDEGLTFADDHDRTYWIEVKQELEKL